MSGSSHFDVLIYGTTAPGIVAAVRAAREGLRVALVSPDMHPGTSFPSLGGIETHYRGVRAPLLQEFADRVTAHYRREGEDSAAFRACTGGMFVTFEPRVAERILREWIEAETRIRWLQGFELAGVACEERRVRSARFRHREDDTMLTLSADAFVEATDEGDLMAAAGAAFRVGREARSEFNEPRAGKVFTRWLTGRFPRAAVEGRLNLTTARATTSDPIPGSTGEADDNIQSYSYRLCLTDDPANRRRLEGPPPGYERTRYAPILLPPEEKERLALPFHHRFLIYSLAEMVEHDHLFHGHALPNRKRSWNATNFTGAGKPYAAGSRSEREAIERAHLEHALGLMWFLQHDPAMPADLRDRARAWGLARDEFVDSGNLPPHLYIREARRLIGRAIFTENDALGVAGANGERRPPIHADSIAFTEFSLDSLACTMERLPGTGALCDGQLFQMEVSRPGHVPFGVLLPREVDNLLVVTTVSATHVGWGTMRQTPTLMHVAEAAAWALVLAARQKVSPVALEIAPLQRQLVEHGIAISFFNDFDASCREPWAPAMQFLATRGLFGSYDADPLGPLDESTRTEWQRIAGGVALEGSRGDACRAIYERVRTQSGP